MDKETLEVLEKITSLLAAIQENSKRQVELLEQVDQRLEKIHLDMNLG